MCIKTLREEGAELTGLWFNPNIHPFTEYRQRRSTLEEYAKTIALPLLLQDEYGLRGFVAAVGEDFSHRCALCYRLRLFGAARAAKAEVIFFAAGLFCTSSGKISPWRRARSR